MTLRRRRSSVIALLVTLIGALPPALAPAVAAAAAPTHRASLIQIENDVMCVVCHESLAVAQAPEAYQERDYIRQLILQGQSKRQIEKDLVVQYGPAVLALPPAHGFNLFVYVVPPVLVILGLATLAITIPRWRRRARAAAAEPQPDGPALSIDDARRLDEELASGI